MTLAAKIIRLFLVLLGVMVLAMTLPELYRKNFEKRPGKNQFFARTFFKVFPIKFGQKTDLLQRNQQKLYD